jgi:hypothetical protein
VRDAAVGDEPAHLRLTEIERESSGELAPEPPAVASANRCECALLRLHDDAHARSARQQPFQVFRYGRALLPRRVSRRQYEADEQPDKKNHPTHDTPLLKTRALGAETRLLPRTVGKKRSRIETCG